jgi:hypothetical protein
MLTARASHTLQTFGHDLCISQIYTLIYSMIMMDLDEVNSTPTDTSTQITPAFEGRHARPAQRP